MKRVATAAWGGPVPGSEESNAPKTPYLPGEAGNRRGSTVRARKLIRLTDQGSPQCLAREVKKGSKKART